jgi:Ca-activated chloride channel family protein
VSVAHPLALALLVVPAAALVLLPGRGLVLRAAAAGALIVALAGLHVGGDPARPTVLVLDRSASGGPAVAAAQERWIRAARRDGTCPNRGCRVVAFAQRAAVAPRGDVGSTRVTDLAAGIDAGADLLPEGGRLVVLSDGVPTTGDAVAAASRARLRGIAVDGVRLAPARVPDAAVVRVHGPSAVHAGDPFTLELTVRSTTAATVDLTVVRDGGAAGAQRVRVRAGDTALTVDETAPAEGWHRYRVAVALDGDRRPADDALDAAVRVAAAPRVLVVEGAPGRAGRLPEALRATGAGVRVTSLHGLPTDAAGLRAEDAVVLADVPERDVDDARVAALTAAVRTGGLGVLALGGEHSLSLGGGASSPLDALLPTKSIEPGGLRRSLALELVLDRSSSMADLAGATPKIDLARQAARAALTVAGANQDELGVVAFDARAHTIVPRRRIATDADAADAVGLLDGLDADGGTSIGAGLAAGLAEVAGSRAPAKHLILLSDGVSEHVDEARLLSGIRRAGATLSTVALGADADRTLLRRLARRGGGRFLDAPDGAALPAIFADEARRSVPSVAVRGRLAVTPSAPSSLTASLADRALPVLGGVVVTDLRAGAAAPLVTRVDGRVVPVLAQWQTGLGRAVTWTPGAGAWAGRWPVDDPRVLTDAVRWVQRAVAAVPLQPTLAAGEPLRALVDPLAAGGDAVDLAALRGTVTPADGGVTRDLAFAQDGPSHYAAALPATTRAQVDVLDLRADDGTTRRTLVAIPYPAEDVPVTSQASVLGQLAELTGGRVLPVGDPEALAPSDGTALWPWFVALALALIVAAAAVDTRKI